MLRITAISGNCGNALYYSIKPALLFKPNVVMVLIALENGFWVVDVSHSFVVFRLVYILFIKGLRAGGRSFMFPKNFAG
jgi:hypothetical protein